MPSASAIDWEAAYGVGIAAATNILSSSNPQNTEFAALEDLEYGSIYYDASVYSLSTDDTGCYRPGVLPIGLALNDHCNLGFFCPNSSNIEPPQFCPPREDCIAARSYRLMCEPQGRLEPQVCQPGHYCPQGGKQQIECPKGSFCPMGSYHPIKCARGALCPAGSQHQILLLPMGFMILIDVVLGLMLGMGFALAAWKKKHRRSSHQDRSLNISKPLPSIEGGPSPSFRTAFREKNHYEVSGKDFDMNGATELSLYPHRAVQNTSFRTNGVSPPVALHVTDVESQGRGATNPGDEKNSEQISSHAPEYQRFMASVLKTLETESIGLAFEFDNLAFATKKGKQIMQGVTGHMPTGSCTGVMGGSGAGKSTFINVLMGRLHNTGGTVRVNGWPKDMSQYRKLIGYVPQDDIVFPELTVRENILHSARVRLPAKWKDQEIQDHVDSLIACLSLTHVQHSRVGDSVKPVVSGGQRKRVNIGMELAAAPMAMFLDEPTSGLDATSAASIMRLLKAIGGLGVTTVAIIHQPREQIFFGFDRLLLLAQGKSVYSGPTEEVQSWFESLGFQFPQRANPADTVMDIINGDGAQYMRKRSSNTSASVHRLIEDWESRGSRNPHEYSRHLPVHQESFMPGGPDYSRRRSPSSASNATHRTERSSAEQEEGLRRTMNARGASWWAQAYYCCVRALVQQLRNSTSFFYEIIVGGLAGLAIGMTAFQSKGHLFQGLYNMPFTMLSSAVDYSSTPMLALLSAMAIGLVASAPGFWVFGEEKLMYWRESASGHSRSAYYVGKLVSTLIRIALSAMHFTVFVTILATPLISFQDTFALCLGYFWCIYGLASIVSMLVKREDGPLMSVLAALVIAVLSGVSPTMTKIKIWKLEWLWRLSPCVYFTEGFFSQNTAPLAHLYNLPATADTVGYSLGQFSTDVGAMFLIGTVYRIIAYAAMILMNRQPKR